MYFCIIIYDKIIHLGIEIASNKAIAVICGFCLIGSTSFWAKRAGIPRAIDLIAGAKATFQYNLAEQKLLLSAVY